MKTSCVLIYRYWYVLLLFASLPTMAQTPPANDVSQIVHDLISTIDQGRALNDRAVKTADPELVIEAVRPILSPDDGAFVSTNEARTACIDWLSDAIDRSENQLIRQRGVELLLNVAAKDPVDSLASHALRELMNRSQLDFSAQACKQVEAMLYRPGQPVELFLVAGVIGGDQVRAYLLPRADADPKAEVGRWYGSRSWYAALALARMGARDWTHKCLRRIDREEDLIIRATKLVEHVAYIRQPEAVQWLADQLASDERLPRFNEDLPGTCVCQYALDALAQIVVDFPVESIGIGYSDEQVQEARQWMQKHPKPEIKR